MSFTDNFGNPKGLLGRMMLVSMDKEHLSMAQAECRRTLQCWQLKAGIRFYY